MSGSHFFSVIFLSCFVQRLLGFNPCIMLYKIQACSRTLPAHDNYFGGAVGGRDYSAGMFV